MESSSPSYTLTFGPPSIAEQPLDSHHWEGLKLQTVDDLMPIGEFSKKSGLSPRRLRSYSAEGLLVPTAVDPVSGYRYYAPEQVSDARVIDVLRSAGMSLPDIGYFLRHRDPEQLAAWERRLAAEAIDRQAALEQARHLVTPGASKSAFPINRQSEEDGMVKFRAIGRTETGPVRENNEDVVLTEENLVLVADGMGGVPGGEAAAHIAANIVRAAFTGRSSDELHAAVRAANWAIRERCVVQPEFEGMGTTICVCGLLHDETLILLNVGDTRAYLWRAGELTQITQDHTVTAELVRRGELESQDARSHPYYGVLIRALGVGPDVEVDSTTLRVESEDRLLISSDGLFNEISDTELADVMSSVGDPDSIVDTMVDLAVSRGARDNVSVVIAEVAA